ncbi:MAG TPA: glycosyltransferase family 1 protein [Polyangiaceae bacterium]|jgi:glycosyltransferase involved in cell wall biosynthesis
MSAPRSTVLIDATPLRTPSGTRGIGRYVYELLHGLADERPSWEDRFNLVVLGDLGPRGEPELTDDLRGAAERGLLARGSVGREVMRWRRQWWLGAAAVQARADLMHETEPLGVPLRGNVPRLVTCYDLIPLLYPGRYLTTPLHFPWQWAKDYRRYARARRVVAISERTRTDALKMLHVAPERIDVVATGINLQRWAAQTDANDDAELATLGVGSRPFLVYVGYGDFRKNIDEMFASLALVRREVDVELAWAGQLNPKHLQKMQRKARAAGVEESVRFLGFVSDSALAALFRRAVAHVFLSRIEGFGLSVAEAMSLGCPVIVAQGSGSDEVARSGGIIVGPNDHELAAANVLRLLREPTFRAERSAACRERVRQFSRQAMARGYLEQYALALR